MLVANKQLPIAIVLLCNICFATPPKIWWQCVQSKMPNHVQDTTRDIYMLAVKGRLFIFRIFDVAITSIQLKPKNRNPCNEYIGRGGK